MSPEWPRSGRTWFGAALLSLAVLVPGPASSDSSSPRLAGYYHRFMVICAGDAYEWAGNGIPRKAVSGVRQVGVGKSNSYALIDDGTLLAWDDSPSAAMPILDGVRRFSAGRSGVFAIRDDHSLWYLETKGLFGFGEAVSENPKRIAGDVLTASVGDSADYYVTRAGRLFVKGRAHRGQYGDGKLTSSDVFIATAEGVVGVSAHTGHALTLKIDGSVWGTGGNIYGPLGRHGYGDKATRWGLIFEGAAAIATGSSHSVAVDRDGDLWIWGRNEDLEPRRIMGGVTAVAAGASATIALGGGALWQWETGAQPRRVMACG